MYRTEKESFQVQVVALVLVLSSFCFFLALNPFEIM